MEPSFIDTDLWSALGLNLKYLWAFVGSIFLLGLSLLFSIGIIPSLVGSGHVPATDPGLAKVVQPLLYITAVIAAIAAILLTAQFVPGIRDTVIGIFNRFAV